MIVGEGCLEKKVVIPLFEIKLKVEKILFFNKNGIEFQCP